MNEAERIVTKLSKDFNRLDQLVQGNGTIEGSVVGRLGVLERTRSAVLKKVEVLETKPCRTPCIFEEYKKKEDEMADKKRTYRIGDIANVIQTFLLVVTMIGIYITLKGLVG